MSIYGALVPKGESGFGFNATAAEVTAGLDLSGKTYVITGCNSGLGQHTLRTLVGCGARVIGTARTQAKAAEACAAVGGDTVPVECELSDPGSVRAAVAAVRAVGGPIHGIIANAGVMAIAERTLLHGIEAQFFTNHVAHFVFVTGLLDELSDDGRVVIVASAAHHRTYAEGMRLDDLSAERGYTPWDAYGQSKLANILFARHLATRLKPGQTANSLHPGVIATNLTRHLSGPMRWAWKNIWPIIFAKSIPQGAATQCYLASHPDAAGITGKHWADCNLRAPSRFGRDDALAAALWDKTEEIVATL